MKCTKYEIKKGMARGLKYTVDHISKQYLISMEDSEVWSHERFSKEAVDRLLISDYGFKFHEESSDIAYYKPLPDEEDGKVETPQVAETVVNPSPPVAAPAVNPLLPVANPLPLGAESAVNPSPPPVTQSLDLDDEDKTKETEPISNLEPSESNIDQPGSDYVGEFNQKELDQRNIKPPASTQLSTGRDNKGVDERVGDWAEGIPHEEPDQLNSKSTADIQPSTGWDNKSVDQRISDWVEELPPEEPDQLKNDALKPAYLPPSNPDQESRKEEADLISKENAGITPIAEPGELIVPEETPLQQESEPAIGLSTMKSDPVAKPDASIAPEATPTKQASEPVNSSSAVELAPIQKSKSLSNIRGIPYDTLVKYTMIVEKAKFNNIIEIKDNGRIGEMILTEKLELSPNEIRALHAVQFLFAVAGNKDRLIEEIPNLFAKDDGIDTLPTLYYKKSEYYEAYGLKKNKNKWNSRSVKIVQDALISLSNKLITYTINYADGEKISINNANLLILGDYKPSSTKKFDTVSLSSFMLLRENKWFGRVGRNVYEKLDNLINVNGRDRYYRLIDELKIVAGNLVNVNKQEFETTITKVRLLDITKISKQNDKIGKDKNLKTLHTCLDNLVKAKILTAWKTLITGSYNLYLNDKVFYRPSKKHSI